MNERDRIYDEICSILTRYECKDGVCEQDLYEMLVEVQNNWEEVITADIS